MQVCRLFEMTTDPGIRDMFKFLIARDTMHQNQWLAAIQELEADGLEMTLCPSNFDQKQELLEVSYQFQNGSEGEDSKAGRWAHGRAPDGRGKFSYVPLKPISDAPVLGPGDPKLYGTPPKPMPSPTPVK